jgi:enoyl-CoA hydratase/3-hydroxyacyl-CoA dehydrogenase
MDRMVEAGKLGMKAGQGFFEWDGDEPVVPESGGSHDISPVVGAMVSEAHRIVADGITDRETLNEVLRRGSGGDMGPFDALDLLGREFLVETLRERHAETGAGVFEPAPSLVAEE